MPKTRERQDVIRAAERAGLSIKTTALGWRIWRRGFRPVFAHRVHRSSDQYGTQNLVREIYRVFGIDLRPYL